MVIKKVFSATVGKDKTLSAASLKVISATTNLSPAAVCETTSLNIFGVLPNSTSSGKSIGVSNVSLPAK